MVKRATIHVSSRKNSATMNKNNQVNNQVENQNHGNHCQHVQIGGQAYYDDRKYFLFSPDTPVPQAVESFRKAGVGQQMSDGTFDFVVRPPMPQPTLRASKGRSVRSWAASLQQRKPMAPPRS